MDIRRAENVWATEIDFDCGLMAVNFQFYDHVHRFCIVGNKQNITWFIFYIVIKLCYKVMMLQDAEARFLCFTCPDVHPCWNFVDVLSTDVLPSIHYPVLSYHGWKDRFARVLSLASSREQESGVEALFLEEEAPQFPRQLLV